MDKEKIKEYGEITLEILSGIAYLTQDLLYTFDPRKIHSTLQNNSFDDRRLFDRLRGLERTGYIELKSAENKNYSIRLTNKGKIKLIENSIDKSVDGLWRMLSFDIPEDLRNKRDLFRRTIKRIGFKQVQKSLWCCPFIKADEVKLAIDEYGLEKYVTYFIVVKTDIEDYLKKLFEKELANAKTFR